MSPHTRESKKDEFIYKETRYGRVCEPVPDMLRGRDSTLSEKNQERQRVYSEMMASSDIVPGGTQGLELSDMFEITSDGMVEPKQSAMDVPVRALVMPLQSMDVAEILVEALDRFLVPVLKNSGGKIWNQRKDLLHTTMYHVSTHENPIEADEEGITKEVTAVSSLLNTPLQKNSMRCSMKAFLERIIITSSGHIVACWQLLGSSEVEVAQLRQLLKQTFPQSKQTIAHDSIIHMTLARIVVFPNKKRDLLMEKLEGMNRELCGLQVSFSQIWYVLEHDRLALALNGRYVIRKEIGLPCTLVT